MNLLGPVILLIPEDLFGLLLFSLLIVGGLAAVVGARRIGWTLVSVALLLPLISVAIEALFNDFFAWLPDALVTPAAILVLLIAYALLGMALLRLLVGEQAIQTAKGQLLADAVKGTLRLAFSRVGLIFLIAILCWMLVQGWLA